MEPGEEHKVFGPQRRFEVVFEEVPGSGYPIEERLLRLKRFAERQCKLRYEGHVEVKYGEVSRQPQGPSSSPAT